MSTFRGLRIAMLAHSTKPRGGVVHAIELAEALHARGHHVTLIAPDDTGRGFFRPTRCEALTIPATASRGGVAELVRTRVADYLAFFDEVDAAGGVTMGGAARFDLWHAQDAISANALASRVETGAIAGFVRTVHHLDHFDDPAVMALQRRGHMSAARVLCVSRTWCDQLATEHGIAALQVANGVDLVRYAAEPRAHDAALLQRLGLAAQRDPLAPTLLAVGGVEARKNTVAILGAFVELLTTHPAARLVIAGGASLLDHSAYRALFDAALAASGLSGAVGVHAGAAQVHLTGPIADADMPALYRAADVLVFPSIKEGFGLVVLEALACGVPVVVSRIAPFTEHLNDALVSWCDPLDPHSIAAATRAALEPARAAASVAAARPWLVQHSWAESAARHEAIYLDLLDQGLGRPGRNFAPDAGCRALETDHA